MQWNIDDIVMNEGKNNYTKKYKRKCSKYAIA